MLHFEFAQIMETWTPARECARSSAMLRDKNVPGIATIHHALRNVDAGAGEIRTLIHIRHAANRTAMHPHAHGKARRIRQSACNCDRAAHRHIRGGEKRQHHPSPVGREINFPCDSAA